MKNNIDTDRIRDTLLQGTREIVTTLCPEEFSEVRADDTFKPDRHLHREILFILHGENQFMLNGLVYPARPGTAFLLNKWETHSFGYRREDRDLLHLWIHFNDERLYGSLVHISCAGQYRPTNIHMNFHDDLHRLLMRRWDMLEKLSDCSSADKNLLIKPVLDIVFGEFAMFCFNMIDYPRENSGSIIVFLLNYIRSANGRDCSLEHLEKLSGYSRFHLSRLFREHCGKTIGDYISEVRLNFVREARKRGLKQKEIADELGFSSPSAFWYWRQKHKGSS